MQGEFERVAYEAGLRSLDKQEQLVEELRTRAGTLLAASSVAASFLGQQAFRGSGMGNFAVLILAASFISICASVFVLLPKQGFTFVPGGVSLYEALYAFREDMPEIYRRLVHEMDTVWNANDRTIVMLGRAYTAAAGALIFEVAALSVLLGGTIF